MHLSLCFKEHLAKARVNCVGQGPSQVLKVSSGAFSPTCHFSPAVLHKQASRMNRLYEQEQYRQERVVFVFQELTGAALVLSYLYLSMFSFFREKKS